jgi:hypothetical protein
MLKDKNMKKKIVLFASLKSLKKGFGSVSGSISQRFDSGIRSHTKMSRIPKDPNNTAFSSHQVETYFLLIWLLYLHADALPAGPESAQSHVFQPFADHPKAARLLLEWKI